MGGEAWIKKKEKKKKKWNKGNGNSHPQMTWGEKKKHEFHTLKS